MAFRVDWTGQLPQSNPACNTYTPQGIKVFIPDKPPHHTARSHQWIRSNCHDPPKLNHLKWSTWPKKL